MANNSFKLTRNAERNHLTFLCYKQEESKAFEWQNLFKFDITSEAISLARVIKHEWFVQTTYQAKLIRKSVFFLFIL